MVIKSFRRVPRHIGVIPDGNRRWALEHGLAKEAGYDHGIAPGFQLYNLCRDLGVEELTLYGFTQDNTKRPAVQTRAFQSACVKAVRVLSKMDASLLVVGNSDSDLFPRELVPFRTRQTFGSGSIKVNFLVNYGWHWDLDWGLRQQAVNGGKLVDNIASADISRVDMIIRWGGRRRLSGFLPVQSIYADFYVVDSYWPDFTPDEFYSALEWYQTQDVTLGG